MIAASRASFFVSRRVHFHSTRYCDQFVVTFSIITPSFNQLDWLSLAVASVQDQVEEAAECALRVEHIIQDAGSPGIEEFAREVGADFYRDGVLVFPGTRDHAELPGCTPPAPAFHENLVNPVKKTFRSISSLQIPNYTLAVYSERDEGMYDAINRGYRRASGDILSYLNCDEQYLPGALKGVVEFFQANPLVEAVFGDALVVDRSGSYICHRRGLPPQLPHTLVSGNLAFTTAATFCRKTVFKDLGLFFDPEWKAMGDVAWAASLCHARIPMRTLLKATSVFADLGSNLGIGKTAMQEQEKLRKSTPAWMQALRPAVILHYRLRKALSGAYFLKPGTYRIFTKDSPANRQEFRFEKPTHRWVGR